MRKAVPLGAVLLVSSHLPIDVPQYGELLLVAMPCQLSKAAPGYLSEDLGLVPPPGFRGMDPQAVVAKIANNQAAIGCQGGLVGVTFGLGSQ